jgi:DNA (cytosine-5)-methyltransferase 1
LKALRPIDDDPELPGFDRWSVDRPGAPTSYARPLRAKNRITTGHRPTTHSDAVVKRFHDVRPGGVDRIGRHPRLRLGGQCPTLRAGTGSDRGSFQSVRPIHPELDRVITVREAARLQGFPDDHLFHPTVWHSFRMIGNSVSPIMAEAVFVAIRDRLARADAESRTNPTASAEVDAKEEVPTIEEVEEFVEAAE